MQLTAEHLTQLADKKFLERGQDYFEKRLLDVVSNTDDQVESIVLGRDVYYTRLFKQTNGEVVGNCTCPSFRDYGPCKHMAATALAVMAENYKPLPSFAYDREQIELKKSQLLKRTPEELINIILELEQKLADNK